MLKAASMMRFIIGPPICRPTAALGTGVGVPVWSPRELLGVDGTVRDAEGAQACAAPASSSRRVRTGRSRGPPDPEPGGAGRRPGRRALAAPPAADRGPGARQSQDPQVAALGEVVELGARTARRPGCGCGAAATTEGGDTPGWPGSLGHGGAFGQHGLGQAAHGGHADTGGDQQHVAVCRGGRAFMIPYGPSTTHPAARPEPGERPGAVAG